MRKHDISDIYYSEDKDEEEEEEEATTFDQDEEADIDGTLDLPMKSCFWSLLIKLKIEQL
eukprot:5986484-Ditylum_brightwellii.AAC.1